MPVPHIPVAERYEALSAAINAGYCLIQIELDATGQPSDYRFLETNSLFVENTGLQDAAGKTARQLVPDIEYVWIERYAQVASSRQPQHFVQGSQAMGRSFDVHAFPVGPTDARLVGILFNDVTSDREREANRRFLANVATVFESEAPLADIMGSVGAKLGDHLGVNSCLFCEIDEAADTITTAYGWTLAGEPNLIGTFRTSEYLNEKFLADSRERRAVVVSDTQVDPRTDADAYARLNIKSFVTIPYFAEGVWTNLFGVTTSELKQWTPQELELLHTFARLVFSKLDRAKADAAVRASELRFRSMADAVPQIVWITDGTGRMEFFNRQWSEYTGIAYVPETAGDVAITVVHPEDIPATMESFQKALETGSSMSVEHRIRSASGDYRWFLVRAEPEIDPATGHTRRVFGASVDIHDRKLMEHELAETDRRKDEFLATLAHELRNPLAPIRTGLTLLQREPSPEAAARTREIMARQLTHLVRLIDDLLDISRVNSNKMELKREELDVRTAVDEAIEASRPAIDQAGHQLFVSLPSKPLLANADRTRLIQLFGNLLGNAAKYTPPGGRIEVAATESAEEFVVQVRDTGIGMEPQALTRIFDMFSQVRGHADRAQGGLGIGLSLVRRLAEMHGGSVSAESAGLGRGSTFTVKLPKAATARASDPSDCQPPQADVRRGLGLLVLDDNVDAAEMMKAVLEAEGHRVHTAYSGHEAMEMMAERTFDAAFLDIGLPDFDGYELARRIRAIEIGRSTVLVALTGWGSEGDRQQAFDSGFDHHLTKPVTALQLNGVLASI